MSITANGDPARQQAPTKRVARGKTATTSTGEKRAAPAARSRKKATVVEDFTEDDVDPIEDDEMEDTVVLEPEPGRKTKGSKKITRPEPAKGRGGKKLANTEGTGPEEEQTESEVPNPGGPKAAKRGGKKVAAATGKEDIPKKRTTKKERDAKEKAEREIAETQFEDMDVDSPPSGHSTTEDEIAPTPTQVHRAGIRGVTVEKTGPTATMKGRKVVRMDKSAAEEVRTEEEEQEGDDLAKPTRAPATVGRGRSNKNPTNGEGEVFKDLEKAYQALRIRYNNLQEAKETEAEQALKTFQKNMKEKDEGCDLSDILYN